MSRFFTPIVKEFVKQTGMVVATTVAGLSINTMGRSVITIFQDKNTKWQQLNGENILANQPVSECPFSNSSMNN